MITRISTALVSEHQTILSNMSSLDLVELDTGAQCIVLSTRIVTQQGLVQVLSLETSRIEYWGFETKCRKLDPSEEVTIRFRNSVEPKEVAPSAPTTTEDFVCPHDEHCAYCDGCGGTYI
jgi:hypothetical protein